ncbi:hypothetical protein ACS0TY_031710 [Phlomoides rotata]
MGFVSQRVERSDLEAGDHIYTYRVGFTYSHHGIYVGEHRVVHFTQDAQNGSSSSSVNSSSTRFSSSSSVNSSSTCCSEIFCGFRKGNSGVTLSCLNCFMTLTNTSLRRYEYGVSRCAFMAKIRGGTCTTAKSDDPEAVIHRAMYLLYNGFGEYKLFRNNCEDFALYCKTGYLVSTKRTPVGGSGQVLSALGLPGAAIISLPLMLFSSNPVVFGTATAVTYMCNRYQSDIGLRTEVDKVEVEDISAFLAAINCGD